MPVNDFLPFATAGGANVLSQADYSALPARLSGFIAGLAKSSEANKAFRQSALIAHVVGQMIADFTGLDVLDDGDTATLLARLKAADRSQRPNWAGAFGGTANALTWTPSPAFASLADLVGVPIVGLTGAAANTGAVTFVVSGLAATAVTWPDGTALANGDLPAASPIILRYDGTAFRLVYSLSPTQIRAITRETTLPGFRAQSAKTQSVPPSTITKLTDYTLISSNLLDATFVSGTLTVGAQTAGLWLVEVLNCFINGTTTQAYFIKNNNTAGNQGRTVTTNGNFSLTFGFVWLAAGDTLDARGWHNAASGQANNFANNDPGLFTAVRISA